jgi:chromosome partitioning protein
MAIILVGGEKGGTGKTTIATNLAAMRAAAKRNVLLIDSDTQGSASIWSQVRSEEGGHPALTCVSLHGRGISAEIRKLATNFDDLIIDAGGRDSIELRQAMLVVELMIVPARASQFDLHGLAAVDRVIGEALVFNPGLKTLVVINCASTHASSADANDMREVVHDMKNLGLAETVLSDRVSFRRAARDGLGVVEYQPADDKARFEARSLYAETFRLQRALA